ncbi:MULTISPECIES: recombinase family protein [Rhodococcus]|uniref:Resolvase/invertase-type recombinase catalytic domain-containing protein n=1 Tax=Rhodococcus erythropolis (strain PR4 / NBRC 100887) TaxID=234621 RepID=C0ZZ10_RHOE4|nr:MULTISPECIES: recombinase family protein [Rhodococcus]BAH33595.1 hypothetical protein RER_28870 [Rhodococcus erythropolis PR4]
MSDRSIINNWIKRQIAAGTLSVQQRPGLQAALHYLRPDDLLTVQEVDRLGRNLLKGLLVLTDLFERGVGVKVLGGIAAGVRVSVGTVHRILSGAATDDDGVLARGDTDCVKEDHS